MDEKTRLLLYFIITVLSNTLLTDGAYIGCFKEASRRRNYSKNPGALKLDEVTPETCYTRCGSMSYLYAGIVNGYQCFCSNTSPSSVMPLQPDGKCSVACRGDPSLNCGSLTHISVWDAKAPIYLSVTTSAKVVASGSPLNLTPTVSSSSGTVSNYALRVDYSDSSFDMGYVNYGTGITSWTYNLAGQYAIKTYANYITEPVSDAVSENGVLVHTPVSGLTLTCPSQMATYEEDTCMLVVDRGTDMTVSFTYTDGGPMNKTFAIADALESSFGHTPLEHLDQANTTFKENLASSGVYFLARSNAKSSGKLVGIEYFGMRSGTITIGVYRPSCANYCNSLNDCGGCATCTGATSFCTDLESCCDGPNVRTEIPTITFAHQKTIIMGNSLGYGYYDATSDNFDVMPGDALVLRVVSGDNNIAIVTEDTPTNTSDIFCQGQNVGVATITPSGCTQTATGVIHQIRAIYAQPSTVKFPMTFNNGGSVTLQASVRNRQITGSATASAAITVLQGVNFAIFNLPTCVESSVPVTLQLLPFTGTAVSVYWVFGDTNDHTVTTAPFTEVQHTYSSPGQYPLSVNISNSLSFKNNDTTICVQEKIGTVNYSIPEKYTGIVELNVQHTTTIVLSSGSDYTCVITYTFADGTTDSNTLTHLTGLILPKTFTIPGTMLVSTTCYNSINSETHTQTLKLVEGITGVYLAQTGCITGFDFQLILEWQTGSGVSLTLQYDTTTVGMTVYDSDRRALSDVRPAETVLSTHNVHVTLSNELGTLSVTLTYTIEQLPSGIELNCTFDGAVTTTQPSIYTVINVGSSVTCYASVASGTNIEFIVDWGDGTANETSTAATASGWTDSKTRTFSSPVFTNITIAVKNSLFTESKLYPVMVTSGVSGISLNSVPFVIFTPPAEVIFTWDTSGVTHIPIGVTAEIFWGDNNNNTINNVDLTQSLNHTYYDAAGNLNLTYTLSNLVDSVTGSILVEVISPIVDMECFTSPKAFSPGVPGASVVKFRRAPGPGVLDLEFDCDTSIAGTDLTRKREHESPDGEDSYNCTFATPGTYTFLITATSVKESQNCTQTFKVLQPVTEDFDILTNAPVDNDFTSNCDLTFQISYTGAPLPDEAFILYDFGDGNTHGPINFANNVQVTHSYATHGHYFTNVTIYNDATSVPRIINSGCYQKFDNLSMVVYRKPFLPLNIADQVPLGTNSDKFLVSDLVKIHTSMSAGTLVWWEITAISTNTAFSCNTTDLSVLSMEITTEGTYNLSVVPNNVLFSGPLVSQIIHVVYPSEDITIRDEGTTPANTTKTFNITMGNYGTDQCVKVYNGFSNKYFGNPTTCAMDSDYSSSRFDSSLDVSQSFSVSYVYTQEGTYNLTVEAWTDFSSTSASFQFPISAIDCRSPTPSIQQSRDFLNPLQYFRSKRIKLVGIANVKCNYTLKNTKLWTVEFWDQNTNTKIADVDITSIPSYNHSELSIDPLWLEYGVYKLTYKITMEASGTGGEEFSGSDVTFIEVVPSDLVVQITEGRMSLLTVGPAVDVTLMPNEYSYDPDANTELGMVKTLDSFAMSCRDVTNNSESFELPMSNETITAYNVSDLPPGLNSGGCFQQGKGWILNFDGSLTFNTAVLEQHHTYEFFVNGTRNTTRFSNDTIRIKVLHDNPPDFKIDFKVPSVFKPHPEGKSFNPNSQLGLVANVSSTCSGCSYEHEWKMFAHDYQYCDLDKDVGCWRELTYLPIHIEGIYSTELTIKTTVFSHYSNVDNFQVRHMVTDPIRAVTGEIHLKLIRNHPPYGGQCTITPSVGVAFEDKFRIVCSGFKDDEQGIASYKITCGSNRNLVAGGLDKGETSIEWTDKTLPIGDENNNYTLSCQVTVTDHYNAEGVYDIDPVTVNKPVVTDIRELMSVMRNRTADEADKIDSEAQLEDTCSFVTTLSALISVASRDDEFSEYNNIGAAVSFRRTKFGETDSRPDAFNDDDFNKTKLEEYKQYQDNTATLFIQLANTMSKCTCESSAEASLLTGSVATLSAGIEFLPRTAQASLTVLLEQGVGVIARNIESNTATVEEVEAVAAAAMDGCANIQQASSLSANHPTLTDLRTQDAIVPFFSSNMDTETDDVATFNNDADVLVAGKTIKNKEEQVLFAVGNVAACNNLKDTIVAQMAYFKTKSNIPTEFRSGSMDMKVVKNDAGFFENSKYSTDVGKVDLPSGILDGESGDDPLVFSVLAQVASGEVNDDSPVSSMSGKVSIKFQYPNGTERRVSNLNNPVRVTINQEQNNNLIVPWSDLPYLDPVIRNGYFFFQMTNVTKKNAAIMIEIRPTNITSTAQLLVVVYYAEKPASTYDKSKVKKACMIPSHTSQADTYGGDGVINPYTCFVDSNIVGENMGAWYIGIRQLQIPELNTIFSKEYLPDVVPNRWAKYPNFTQNFKMKAKEINCVYMDDGSSVIRYDGVQPSAYSTDEELVCETVHLTTFTGGLAVAPNTIDWNFVFSNADFLKNPTLYITEMLIFVLYIIAMIWARRKDKRDVEKLGLAPLLDNDPRDKYYYEIMVNTGMRRNAGTESKVHFILSGEEDETEVRTFTDKKRKIMCRGNTDGFLMAVPSSLGALNYLRIWHDNSGQGKMASWYLNYIVIRDVQTDKKYYFIANKWFAVEEDDGQVDRVIPVAGKEQMTEFSHLFAERASKNLSDGHLWFSVVARPPQSRFTRCQRVSCCLCLLYVSMLANAMFYELATSDSSAFQFGPFAMSLEQIYVGVITNIIIFPVNFLIMTLFRKSRPRKLRPSRVEEALKSSPQRTTSMTDVNPRVKSSMDVDRPGSSFLMDAKRSASSMSRPESSMSAVATRIEQDKSKKKCQLPWWCVIVAWILLWLTVLVSAAFVTFYGIMFQDIKCRKWITSLLISFFTSIFLTQPIKVFLFAIVFSLIIRKPENEQDEDDDEEPRKQPDYDEEYLYKEEDYSLVGPQRPMYKPKPPNAKVLEAARQKRLKEIQMWAVIREIVIYAFFLWILMVISYRSVSSDSYNYKFNMEKVFVTTNDTNHMFTKIKNVQDFWVWAKSGMLRGLRAGPYYNNFPPFYLRGYINDKVSRLMGYAVLRQLRIQPGSCKIPSQVDDIIDECNAPFEIPLEETGNYGPNWTDIGTSNGTREEYLYQDANTLNGYPYWGNTGVLYSGGGYIYRLNRDYFQMIADLDQLESEKWIDEYTRAVFLEFTVYNPSINLFAISTLLAEFRPSGGVIPTYRFEPCNLLPYNTGVLIFQIICEVVYLIFTVCFVCKEIRNLYKQKLKYFTQFWNIIEFSICAMSVSATVIYFYRLICINDLSTYFRDTNGNGYMKFQYVGYWSELFMYMIGFLVFFASLKFLKLLRFNKRISLLADTLKNSAKDLIHFSIIFNIVFLAFVQVFYLVYHSHLDIFKTFMSSCEAGIVMMMGKFDIYNMSKVNQWFTQIFLFLFVVTITFIVVNMFLSILNDTFGTVRSNLAKQQNDYEIIDFMMNRFKCWTGLGKNNNATISPADMEAERARNYQTLEGQIDYFPNQIDRFLASISHMYMEKSKFDDFLQKGAYGKMMMKARAHNDPFTPHPAPSHPGALRLSHGARGMTDVQTD